MLILYANNLRFKLHVYGGNGGKQNKIKLP